MSGHQPLTPSQMYQSYLVNVLSPTSNPGELNGLSVSHTFELRPFLLGRSQSISKFVPQEYRIKYGVSQTKLRTE